MKIIVEKDEANEIKFDPKKKYIVLKDFNHSFPLGIATISVENNIMYANISLNVNIEGYPSIGYRINESIKILSAIGICNTTNLDESIKSIKYTK